MINILIKSYNRAFYLDRAIKTIVQNVSGSYFITVLDDGTPPQYLEKIKHLYPQVSIVKSENYESKSLLVRENVLTGKTIDSMKIPTKMWVNEVRKSEDYVLVTEDDVWFTKKIDFERVISQMKKFEVQLVKLGWLGNYKDDKNLQILPLSDILDTTIPKGLFTSNELIMDVFMYNKMKFFSLLYKLGFVDNSTKQKYWALNSILMGIYRKEYWLHIWKDAAGKVDEKQQLRNAAVWYHKNKKNKNLIARTKQEYLKTTFQSSATNSYHEYGFDFDVNYFNFIMNEAWLKGDFDSMQNYPQDFSINYFEQFFDDKMNKNEFRKWVEKFKKQYENLGAKTD